MLHRALFGSLERFIGILIENYAGKLPFWLSPAQAVVCPIAEENNDYVKKLFEDLFKEGIKCEMDLRNEKINYKVREHSLAKVPFIIVCGKKEVAENTVTVRKLGSDKQETMKREDLIMSTTNLALDGKHNIKNAMAASTVAHLLKIRKATIRESLEGFQGAEHRLEQVLTIHKVKYVNDSKATNVNATYYALESMNTPTVWIVGGVDKGNDYSSLFPFINEKVKAIICLGKNNESLFDAFGNMVDTIIETQYMSEAVKIAYNIATPGEAVLLSPACASFDLFENYEDRGQQFKAAVRQL